MPGQVRRSRTLDAAVSYLRQLMRLRRRSRSPWNSVEGSAPRKQTGDSPVGNRVGDMGARIVSFCLVDLADHGGHQEFGFHSILDYAETRFGIQRRTAREYMAVERALSTPGRSTGAIVKRAPDGARAPVARRIRLQDIPEVIDTHWWNSHAHLLRWKAGQGTFEFRPGEAVALLRSARDLAAVRGRSAVGVETVRDVLDQLGVDDLGLWPADREYMDVLDDAGSEVSLSTIAARLGAPRRTVRRSLEPYLIRRGLIEITPRGRALSRPR